ncbi:MAG TPA: hypothetical protein V6D43_22290, partial [Candidatus Sericytochromatia bacterium]
SWAAHPSIVTSLHSPYKHFNLEFYSTKDKARQAITRVLRKMWVMHSPTREGGTRDSGSPFLAGEGLGKGSIRAIAPQLPPNAIAASKLPINSAGTEDYG